MNAVRRLIARRRLRREAMIEVAIERHIRHSRPRLRFSRETFFNLYVTFVVLPGWTCYCDLATGTGITPEDAYNQWRDNARYKLAQRKW